MLKYFIDGGEFMYPILVVFIIGLIISVVKLITLLASGKNAGKLMQDIKKATVQQGPEGALKFVKGNKPLEQVLNAGIRNANFGFEAAERSIVSEGEIQVTYLEKGMIWLSTVVAIAPMLGFLGTVVGMVSAMESIAQANDVSPSLIAGDISVALLTTAFGLIVALVIQTMQNIFSNIIDNRVLDMQEASVAYLETLTELEKR